MGAQTSWSFNNTEGFPGMVDMTSHPEFLSMKNADAVSIPIGRGVAFKTSAPATELDAILPVTENAKFIGIVAHRMEYSRAYTTDGATYGDLDSTGIRVGKLMVVMTKGRILVTATTGCAPGDPLFVRGVAGGGEALGTLENADDSTDTVDASARGTWLSSASAGQLAWLLLK